MTAESIDLNVIPPGAQVLSLEPLLIVVDHAVSPVECDHLKLLASEHMKKAGVVLDDGYGTSAGRTGSHAWLRYRDDPTVAAIGERIAQLVGLPLANAEALQVLHYGHPQAYRAHYDAFTLGTRRGQRAAKWGGQRLATALVYLNDVAEGGETEFPRLNAKVAPKPGRLVIFHNTTSDIRKAHPDSLHAGCPVIKGEKWAFNMWFRHKPISEEYAAEESLPAVAFSLSKPSEAPRSSEVLSVNHLAESADPAVASKADRTCIWVHSNRAETLWQHAASAVEIELSPPATHALWVTDWDTFDGTAPPAAPKDRDYQLLTQVERKALFGLADRARLRAAMERANLSHLTLKAFSNYADARAHCEGEHGLWFTQNRTGFGAKNSECLSFQDLHERSERGAPIPEHWLLRALPTELAHHDRGRIQTRSFIVLHRGQCYRLRPAIAHTRSTDSAREFYTDWLTGKSGQLMPLSALGSSAIDDSIRTLQIALKPLFNDLLPLADENHFVILSIDSVLLSAGRSQLLELSPFPFLPQQGAIATGVIEHMLADLLRLKLGLATTSVEVL